MQLLDGTVRGGVGVDIMAHICPVNSSSLTPNIKLLWGAYTIPTLPLFCCNYNVNGFQPIKFKKVFKITCTFLFMNSKTIHIIKQQALLSKNQQGNTYNCLNTLPSPRVSHHWGAPFLSNDLENLFRIRFPS